MRRGKLDKFLSLIVYIVREFGEAGIPETKLWKLLYFCEADFFEKSRKTITGIGYYKNHYGATPDIKAVNAISDELKNNLNIVLEARKEKKDKVKKYFPKKVDFNFDFSALESNEIVSIKDTCEQYYQLGVNKICLLAHQDPPYLGAKMKERIDFSFVDYRLTEEDYTEKEKDNTKYTGSISDETMAKLLSYVG